ncbi:rCG62005 [Rattus norvegicus]|jgi:hypothetical protein|nr:rCG62005 [Rattus norvegicus]
MSGISP